MRISSDHHVVEVSLVTAQTKMQAKEAPSRGWATFALAAVLTVTMAACSSDSSNTGSAETSGIKSSDVTDAFTEAGLEATEVRPMTRDDYGLAPYLAIEGSRFLIPSLGDDAGGRVMTFDSDDDLQRTRHYYDELGESSAALFSYTFVNGNVLVQINGDLPEAKAQEYDDVLQAVDLGE